MLFAISHPLLAAFVCLLRLLCCRYGDQSGGYGYGQSGGASTGYDQSAAPAQGYGQAAPANAGQGYGQTSGGYGAQAFRRDSTQQLGYAPY